MGPAYAFIYLSKI